MGRFRSPKLNLEFQPWPNTHLAVLIDYVRKTDGPVLELGIGPGSTLVLHELCRGRKLVSYEYSKDFYDAFAGFKSEDHDIVHAPDWDAVDFGEGWDIAFVDHSPAARRKKDLPRLIDCAQYVIVHDTEPDVDRFYLYSGSLNLYKYRKDYTSYKPYTTVLSNFHAL